MMRSRAGFTIWELLIVLGLMTAFGLAGTRLFQATIRVGHSTAEAQNAAASFDSALALLRGDAWGVGEIATPDPQTVKLGSVTWTIKGTVLSRDVGGGKPPRQWAVPDGLTFAAEPPALVLRLPTTKASPGGDVRVVSEIQLLSRLSP